LRGEVRAGKFVGTKAVILFCFGNDLPPMKYK